MEDPIPKENHDLFTPFPYPLGKKISFPKPSNIRSKDFLKVILTRRSERLFKEGITIEGIVDLLYFVNKIESCALDQNDFLVTRRTVPSGGGRHPIDILVSMPDEMHKRQFDLYNPIDHSLTRLLLPQENRKIFFKKLSINLNHNNACIFWFSIQKDKTASKYHNPESIFWRDAGALIYCIQLISHFFELKSCPVGTLASQEFSDLFSSSKILSGGGIYIGK